MESRILCVTATETEANAVRKVATPSSGNIYSVGRHKLTILVAGVGSVSTVWNMCKWISAHGKPDFAFNAGIAGSFRESITPGTVVAPSEDCFADAGVDDNGNFLTLAEAGLSGAGAFPFVDGILPADKALLERLVEFRKVRAVTVNTASGSATAISRIVEKFNPDIETMEGAAFFYICRCESIPFFSLRAISNLIEPRNRESWNVRLALENLSASLGSILLKL
jgi:futalosine hydrolase